MTAEEEDKFWAREITITLAEAEAREERLAADLVKHTRDRPPLDQATYAHIAVGVIDIPIWQPSEISKRKSALPVATPITQERTMTTAEKIAFLKADPALARTTKRPGSFFTNDPTVAINATARGKFLPADATEDDKVNEITNRASVGLAADYLNCEASGQAGAGCAHGDLDHVKAARQCLDNVASDAKVRAKKRADAGKAVGVRFAS